MDIVEDKEPEGLVPNSTARCIYCKNACHTMCRHTRGFDEDTSIFNLCAQKTCPYYGKIVPTE